MKLLLPLKVGDVIRTNYGREKYRIIEVHGDCTCPNYVDQINSGGKAKKRVPHLHFVMVDADEPPTKKGTYAENKQRYLGGYIYQNGECVDIDGPNIKGTAGWHKVDDGLDKIILVRAASNSISKLTKPTTRRVRP